MNLDLLEPWDLLVPLDQLDPLEPLADLETVERLYVFSRNPLVKLEIHVFLIQCFTHLSSSIPKP